MGEYVDSINNNDYRGLYNYLMSALLRNSGPVIAQMLVDLLERVTDLEKDVSDLEKDVNNLEKGKRG